MYIFVLEFELLTVTLKCDVYLFRTIINKGELRFGFQNSRDRDGERQRESFNLCCCLLDELLEALGRHGLGSLQGQTSGTGPDHLGEAAQGA